MLQSKYSLSWVDSPYPDVPRPIPEMTIKGMAKSEEMMLITINAITLLKLKIIQQHCKNICHVILTSNERVFVKQSNQLHQQYQRKVQSKFQRQHRMWNHTFVDPQRIKSPEIKVFQNMNCRIRLFW